MLVVGAFSRLRTLWDLNYYDEIKDSISRELVEESVDESKVRGLPRPSVPHGAGRNLLPRLSSANDEECGKATVRRASLIDVDHVEGTRIGREHIQNVSSL